MTKFIGIIKFIFLFITTLVYTQELPPIENYAPKDYGAGNQNWSISQSDDKYIYVGNNTGLLEFNGANWKLYPSPNGTIIRSVKVINDLIYTGCYMEFGYWKKDEFGNLKYHSLKDKLQEPLIEDEHFWNILKFDDWVLFQSLDRIYVYNTIDGSFNIINSKSTKAEIFTVANSIYFQIINEGIFKIENGKPILATNDPIFQKNVLVGVFLINNKTLLLSENGEFYFLEDKGLKLWNISAYSELKESSVYSSLQLNDGSFILGTISNGIYHIDRQGNFIKKINQEKGLINNTVLSIFEDIDQNLWLGLDNGISIINLRSPFSVYNDLYGRLGAVNAAIVFNEMLYLGTNQGLFFKNVGSSNDFKFIENTKGQVWCLKEIDNTLFCGHNRGTFVIKDNKAKQVSDFPGTWDIKEIKTNKNILLQGNYTGLSILKKDKGQWQLGNKITGFDISSRFFEMFGDNRIIVNHEFKGIFNLVVDTGFDKIVEVKNSEPNGFGSSLVNYQNVLIYASNTGVFKFNINRQDFIKDSLLSGIFMPIEDQFSGRLIANDETNKLWGFTSKNIICLSPGKFDSKPQSIKISIPNFFRGNQGLASFECVTHLKDEKYLIGASNGYTVLNLDQLVTQEYFIRINAIYKDYLNPGQTQVELIDNTKFKSNENNLNIEFSVAEFDKYTEVNYQYKLEGLNDNWSNWFGDSNISLKNLPYGDYTFKVRALIGNELSSNTASYSFIIERPWYLTNVMLIFYALLLSLILLLIHLNYRRHYRKQQQKLLIKKQNEFKVSQLENEKVIMTLKNEKLKHDVENKNRELTIATMSIIKKNEVLNRIKKELMQHHSEDINEQVIKTINKNINNKKDWEFIEDAFNNADKDFLKKIKKLHPTLTPNDLRFCAYLRLNLSSKEIAPLLNISVRSVEIKRYRLRKKMNLLHEKSLIEYILEI